MAVVREQLVDHPAGVAAIVAATKVDQLGDADDDGVDLGESRQEVVNADVVLDGLDLIDEGELRLHEGRELLLGREGQLADEVQVRFDDGDLRLYDCLLDDDRIAPAEKRCRRDADDAGAVVVLVIVVAAFSAGSNVVDLVGRCCVVS